MKITITLHEGVAQDEVSPEFSSWEDAEQHLSILRSRLFSPKFDRAGDPLPGHDGYFKTTVRHEDFNPYACHIMRYDLEAPGRNQRGLLFSLLQPTTTWLKEPALRALLALELAQLALGEGVPSLKVGDITEDMWRDLSPTAQLYWRNRMFLPHHTETELLDPMDVLGIWLRENTIKSR